MALHSATVDPELADGDAKLSGRAVEVTDSTTKAAFIDGFDPKPPEPYHLFRVDVSEIVLTRVGDPADHLVIESWREGRGIRRVERR